MGWEGMDCLCSCRRGSGAAVRRVSAALGAAWMCKGKDEEPPQGPEPEILLDEESES